MKRKNRLLQENNNIPSFTRRRIEPLTAAGVLLIAISVTALITYAALVLPSKIVAAGGPPDEFIAAATQQSRQATQAPTPLNTDEDEASMPEAAEDSAAGESEESAIVPTLTPTENPRGDWPLPENVQVDYWISIPNIGLEAPIIALSPREREIDGVVVERLPVPHSYSVAWDASSAEPGFVGNTIMTGHNNLYGGVLQNLQNVQLGWEIAIWSEFGVFSYYVSTIEYVEEDDVAVEQRMKNSHWLAPTGDNRLTLITCWPNVQSTHRLIVVATR